MLTLKPGDKGEHVALVQRILHAGEFYTWKVDGDYGARTKRAVSAFQATVNRTRSGIVDPATFEDLLEFSMELLRHAKREHAMTSRDVEPHDDAPIPKLEDTLPESDDVDLAGAIAWAEAEWLQVVQEPRGENWERIDSYIRGEQGLHWSWEDRYDQNGEFAWCGAFVARALGELGLRRELRVKSLASTYRIVQWAKGTDRYRDDVRECRAGDIVIVGDGRKACGNHITLCYGVEDNDVLTFEGNARGPGPDGRRYEGVIRRRRPFSVAKKEKKTYRVMHVVRVKAGDFDAS